MSAVIQFSRYENQNQEYRDSNGIRMATLAQCSFTN